MQHKTLMQAKTKVAAAMFAAAMTMSAVGPIVNSVPVYAVTYDASAPESLKKTISVSNIEDGATVTAYQVLKGQYIDGDLEEYVLTDLGSDIEVGNYGTSSDNPISTTGYDTAKAEDLVEFDADAYSTDTGRTVSINGTSCKIYTNGTSYAFQYDSKWYRVGTKTTEDSDGTTTYFYYSTDESCEFTGFLENYTSKVASKIKNGSYTGISMTDSDEDGTYTATAEPGLYVVLVTDTSSGSLYNPMLVSVNVSSTGATGETVDATSKFQNGDGITGYAKSSSTGLKKTIVTDGNGVKGDTSATSQLVKFKLDGITVPAYSSEYGDGLIFKIVDTLESGVYGSIEDLQITVGDTNLITYTNGSNSFKYTGLDTLSLGTAPNSVLTAKFSDAFIRAHGGESVVITYSARLLENASKNYAENSSQAVLTWSNDSSDVTKTASKKASVYNYTFGIDAAIDSEDKSNTSTTYELNKTFGESGNFTSTSDGTTKKSAKALEGAKFTLYSDQSCTTPVTTNGYKVNSAGNGITYWTTPQSLTATSDENGHLSFSGLDAGTYYLKETSAPTGYDLSDTVYKVVIAAETNSDTGILTKYSVTTYSSADNFAKALGTSTYTNSGTIGDDGTVTNKITQTVNEPVEIINKKTGGNATDTNLPFTGGEGDYIFYITTVGAIGLAGTVFVIRKKLKETM